MQVQLPCPKLVTFRFKLGTFGFKLVTFTKGHKFKVMTFAQNYDLSKLVTFLNNSQMVLIVKIYLS